MKGELLCEVIKEGVTEQAGHWAFPQAKMGKHVSTVTETTTSGCTAGHAVEKTVAQTAGALRAAEKSSVLFHRHQGGTQVYSVRGVTKSQHSCGKITWAAL